MNKIESQADIEKILTLISGIKGQKCWDVRYFYDQSISLDIGQKIYHEGTKTVFGEWWLNTCATNFALFREKQLLVTESDERQEVKKQLELIRDTTVESIQIDLAMLDLTIKFSGEIYLELRVTAEDDEYEEIPYWSIFTPDRKVISVGPNRHWNIKQE